MYFDHEVSFTVPKTASPVSTWNALIYRLCVVIYMIEFQHECKVATEKKGLHRVGEKKATQRLHVSQ
jgi:hypothetical protein